MSYRVEKLANEPIIVAAVNADYSAASEAEQFLNATLKGLESLAEPAYLVLDSSAVSLNLDDMLQGTRLATQQHQLFKHPNIIESIMVTPNRFMKLIVQGLNNPIFGNINIYQVESLDAAIAYARSQNAKQSK